jgi:hypothetical protein
MEPLLDLPIDQFFGALDELGLDPERRSDLLREYRRRNSAFSPVYGLLDSVANEDAAAGMQRADIVPISRPEGMSVFDAVRSGEAQLAVPQGLLDTVNATFLGIDAPSAAYQGLIPEGDMAGEGFGTAAVMMGLGGLLARPMGSLGTGGRVATRSGDETPAQQVARLLREGRSDEVTDDLMAQTDPQEMYQLYVSGETGMDLAMDEASRMARAREMGFDTDAPLYHGTNFDFRNFFQNPEVRRFENRASRRGTWFSTNPDDAEFYGETIYPVFVSGRYQNLPSMEEMGADVVDRLMSIRPQNIETDLAAEEFVDFLRSAKPPGFYTDVAGTRMSQAQRQGFDGVRLIGGETVQQISEPGDNVAVFDPRNIRSRFARFDPRLSHLSNLNAANIDPLTGAAAMGASQQQQDPLASLRAYLAQNGLLSQ